MPTQIEINNVTDHTCVSAPTNASRMPNDIVDDSHYQPRLRVNEFLKRTTFFMNTCSHYNCRLQIMFRKLYMLTYVAKNLQRLWCRLFDAEHYPTGAMV